MKPQGGSRGPRHGGRGMRHRPETPPQLLSNLQSVLLHSAPTVPMFGDLEPSSTAGSYLTLADLWQSYEAWSAYGCEVPMRIQVDGVWQEVIQCYTPYLSGIQLFGADHTRRIRPSLTPSSSSGAVSSYCSDADEDDEEGGSESADESLSVGSGASSAYTCSTASTASTASDSEDGESCCDSDEAAGCCKRGAGPARGVPAAAAAAARLARHAARGSVLQKQHGLGEPSRPLFEFQEVERPHLRAPLYDVVMELAEQFPGLLTLDTRDLHPTSWFAVTWVPIYRIPSIPDPSVSRDLQANFLTFHSLAVPVPRLHAAPQDLCSIAPLPPLLDPIGAAAVAWRTEVARQQLLSNVLSAISTAQQQQQSQAQGQGQGVLSSGSSSSNLFAASSSSSPCSSAASTPLAGGSPVVALAAQLAAAQLDLVGTAAIHASAAAAAQLPVAAACLRPFAFMPYKVSGRTWVDDWNLNRQHLPMIAAAGSWIERRKVQLPDFDFMSQMYRPLPTGYGSR